MDGKQIFKGSLDQNTRVGSDVGFWAKVYQQLAEAEDVYARRLQKVVDTLDEKLGQSKVADLKATSKDFSNLTLHVETFKDHVITQKRKATDTMQANCNTALGLRRSSKDGWVKTANRVDAITMEGLVKEFKKKEKSVAESKLAYHREMEGVEQTKITMLRLGYNRDTLDRTLEKLERGARETRARYKHCIRQAENQMELLTSAARQCERDWKEVEIDRTGHVISVIDSYLRANCPTCMKSEESLSGFINIPKLACSLTVMETVPTIEFEEYEMTLMRLVMSKLNCQVSNRSETDTGHFDYSLSKVKGCHVIKSFSDKRPHFLSVRKGMSVTELIPPTSQGWAYGETKNRNGKAVKFGFYNVSCVEYTTV